MTGAIALIQSAMLAPSELAFFIKKHKPVPEVHGLPVLIWLVIAIGALGLLALVALSVYRGRVARDEAGQIFLDDTFVEQSKEEAMIQAKVSKVEPAIRIATLVTVCAIAVLIIYFAYGFCTRLFS